MRLQTRFFLGAGALVLAMAAAQWLIMVRQLASLEREVGVVVSSVGEELLSSPVFLVQGGAADGHRTMAWVAAGDGEPAGGGAKQTVGGATSQTGGALPPGTRQRIEVRVERESEHSKEERFLIVRASGGVAKVQIPTSPVTSVVQRGVRQGLLSSGLVLLAGLLGAAVMARRVSRPLRRLAEGADALARGEVGTQVEPGGGGEVAEVGAAFNRMSEELERLEQERERWRAREQLAQLGELARGLAHTVRNPLNTLGLTVEELTRAGGAEERQVRLAATAREEIRRIDRWMRSFLAVAAGDGAEAARVDAGAVARDAVLEAVQRGARIDLDVEPAPLLVRVVPAALRAALANLVDNAVTACPDGPVRVEVRRSDSAVEVRIEDRGPGLPAAVRDRLFRPHTTTRAEGSGMGLYLARELVRADGGSLSLEDAAEGGTVAMVSLPLAEGHDDSV